MIVIVCVVSCSKKETGCDDAYYYFDNETNKAIFYLNNEYVSYDSESKKVKDTACKTYDFRSDFESGNYVKHDFISTASNFDTVEIANCLYLDKLFISLIYKLYMQSVFRAQRYEKKQCRSTIERCSYINCCKVAKWVESHLVGVECYSFTTHTKLRSP